jgi:hypothetical protein
MTRRLAIAALVAWALAAGTARAQTAFGGDDSGFVPPDDANFKYESKVAKNVNKYQKCHLKCHEKRASGKLPDETNEENCENGCKGKYDTSNSKLTAPAPASGCLNTDSVRQLWHGVLDSFNSQIYCEGTTPFGGEDTGNVPSTKDFWKCEKKVGKNVAKLLKCQSGCHQKRAQGKLADTTSEETCEDTCGTKYDTASTKITGCPSCQSMANMTSLGATMRSQGDSNNGLVYCAQ